jgi:hypothetical protein
MATKGDISDLDVLIFGGKPKIPQLSGYNFAKRSGVIQSDAEGGLTRQRKKFYGNTYLANVTFSLNSLAEQDLLRIFFERNEGKRFVCYLRMDRPLIEPYVVQVVSEWQESLLSKRISILQVTLEVVSARCPDLDELMFTLYQCQGNYVYEIMKLTTEATVQLP